MFAFQTGEKTLFCENDFVIFRVLTLCRFLRLLLCCAQVFLCPYCHIFIRNSNRAVWTTSKNHAANTPGYGQNCITPKAEKTEKLSLKMIFLWTWRAQVSSRVQFSWIFCWRVFWHFLALVSNMFEWNGGTVWGQGVPQVVCWLNLILSFWLTIITE